jgi:hypothetical protein
MTTALESAPKLVVSNQIRSLQSEIPVQSPEDLTKLT